MLTSTLFHPPGLISMKAKTKRENQRKSYRETLWKPYHNIVQNYCILLLNRGQQSLLEYQSLSIGFFLTSLLDNSLFIELSPSSGFFFSTE